MSFKTHSPLLTPVNIYVYFIYITDTLYLMSGMDGDDDDDNDDNHDDEEIMLWEQIYLQYYSMFKRSKSGA